MAVFTVTVVAVVFATGMGTVTQILEYHSYPKSLKITSNHSHPSKSPVIELAIFFHLQCHKQKLFELLIQRTISQKSSFTTPQAKILRILEDQEAIFLPFFSFLAPKIKIFDKNDVRYFFRYFIIWSVDCFDI